MRKPLYSPFLIPIHQTKINIKHAHSVVANCINFKQKHTVLYVGSYFPEQGENHLFGSLCSHVSFRLPFFLCLCLYRVGICVCLCHSCSNRVEAWTRDVQFLLRQEGRPVTQLVGNMSTVRIMRKDWENTDKAAQWIHHRAESSHQPFALYLGLNLPHPYKTESMGPTAGGSTFLTSPYWLEKAGFFFACFLNVFTPLLQNCIACFYVNHYKSSYFTHTHRCHQNSSLFQNGFRWLPCTPWTTTPPSPKTAVAFSPRRKSNA